MVSLFLQIIWDFASRPDNLGWGANNEKNYLTTENTEDLGKEDTDGIIGTRKKEHGNEINKTARKQTNKKIITRSIFFTISKSKISAAQFQQQDGNRS